MMEPLNLPLFPLRVVLFPGMLLPLHIFEVRYKKMVADCLKTSTPFGVVLIRSGSEPLSLQSAQRTGGRGPGLAGGEAQGVGPRAHPFSVGTTAIIANVVQLGDGRLHLIAVGENRFEVEDIIQVDPYYVARAHYLQDEDAEFEDPGIQRLAEELEVRFTEYVDLVLSATGQGRAEIELPKRPDLLTHVISAAIGVSLLEKQRLLEMTSIHQRLRSTLALVTRQNVDLRSFRECVELLEGRRDPACFCPFSLN